jgi:hypothetical protein
MGYLSTVSRVPLRDGMIMLVIGLIGWIFHAVIIDFN